MRQESLATLTLNCEDFDAQGGTLVHQSCPNGGRRD
jgi:hypothetical protein